MNWGIKITVVYLCFVALILALVITCYGHKSELEYKDYYVRELKFQERITAAANADSLPAPISYIIRDRSVQLILPKEVLTKDMNGAVYFLRPSDASRDKVIQLAPDADGVQMLDPGFLKGIYRMQISIGSGHKHYFKEAVLTFN